MSIARSIRTAAALAALLAASSACAPPAAAQANWGLVIRDDAAGTPANQVNGVAGAVASLFAVVLNYTGTSASDAGGGSPAPATELEFAGFGWTLLSGQTDLGSLFTPDLRIPGYPLVPGSPDGSLPGSSGAVLLGTFDLSGLAPGVYEQDFAAAAFPTAPDSTLDFGEARGTVRLSVTAASVPEASSSCLLFWVAGACAVRLLGMRRTGAARGGS